MVQILNQLGHIPFSSSFWTMSPKYSRVVSSVGWQTKHSFVAMTDSECWYCQLFETLERRFYLLCLKTKRDALQWESWPALPTPLCFSLSLYRYLAILPCPPFIFELNWPKIIFRSKHQWFFCDGPWLFTLSRCLPNLRVELSMLNLVLKD